MARRRPRATTPGKTLPSGPGSWSPRSSRRATRRSPAPDRDLKRSRGSASRPHFHPMDSDPRRPWESGEFSPSDPRPIVLIDAAAELANGWAASLEGDDEELAATDRPFSAKFPGLASAPPLTDRILDDRDLLEKMRDRRLS